MDFIMLTIEKINSYKSYSEAENDILSKIECPYKPQKPILKKEHTSNDITKYQSEFVIYELGMKSYEIKRKEYNEKRIEFHNIVEKAIIAKSGAKFILKDNSKLIEKVYSKACELSSDNYDSIYYTMVSLLEIFE